ncbi:Gp49 family protein [Alteromonas sp. BMJM2]|uniref:Gp49 family protein n=1 Tax=Alteromonas sp. BMJM2 TaxID=2954241 RepID=UPI0022B4E5E1|nr:Gp49 family protein [Alteromonas sp. BMJM2]
MKFKEYQGKAIIRKAFEITSREQFIVEHQIIDDTYRFGLKLDGKVIEFVAHEPVNVGDFVVYLNESDIYHCSRKVFLERNDYPAIEDKKHKVEAPKRSVVIQDMMKKLGCDGAFISSQSIIDRIEDVDFQTIELAGQKMMYCGIRMKGGFVVTGKPSVCISPENWRDEIGQKISFENAFQEIYKLEAYRFMTSE